MGHTRWITEEYITTWHQFDETIRSKGCRLLKRLDEFPKSILVTGCQRSGTTMLARIITQSDEMTNYWFGPDDELDAALILSGYVDHRPERRYCFQTTYVNNRCCHEYYEHANGHKIIWLVRNPLSVVYSFLYNWSDYALNSLFEDSGAPLLTGTDAHLYKLFGVKGIPRLRRACLGYNGKSSQLFDLRRHLGPDRVMVVDYDELVTRKEIVLPAIYSFIELNYQKEYADRIHSKSLSKARQLSKKEIVTVKALCEPVYQQARSYLSLS